MQRVAGCAVGQLPPALRTDGQRVNSFPAEDGWSAALNETGEEFSTALRASHGPEGAPGTPPRR